MTKEQVRRPEKPEVSIQASTDYEESVSRLYDILDYPTVQDGAVDFYSLEWSDDHSQKLRDITLVKVAPTGARREVVNNLFYQAQFKVTQTRTFNSDWEQDFQWMHTGPQPVGTPIEPDLGALADEYGYYQLNATTMTEHLRQRARTAGDYMALLGEMKRRGIDEVSVRLAKDINKQLFRLATKSDNNPLDDMKEREGLFELFLTFRKVNPLAAKSSEGHLVSRLLRATAWGWTTLRERNASSERQDRAAAVLQAAIEANVIPDEPRTMHRVLGSMAVYRYGFTTELLHRALTSEDYNSTTLNVFHIDRRAFAHDYILMQIDERLRSSKKQSTFAGQRAEELLSSDKLLGHISNEVVSFTQILDMADALEGQESETTEAGLITDELSIDTEPAGARIRSIETAFAKILDSLQSDDPEVAAVQKLQNQKAVESVTIVLERPVRKLSKKAIEAAAQEALQEDDISDEDEDAD